MGKAMEPVKTIVIGMGKMGQIRCRAMANHGGYQLVAVCDADPSRCEGWNVPIYTDWHACLAESDAQAVIVCTFNNVIADIVCEALAMGLHVFSEKPPGRSLAEAMRMQSALQATKGLILKFGFNHRYHNSIIEARALVDSGLLGDIVCARGVYGKAGGHLYTSEWRNDVEISGGGILLDQGIHMMDLLCYFLGDFTSISSMVDRLVWDDIATEDSAFAILKSAEGKTASLHSSAIQWKHKFDLDIICTKGYIALNGLLTATQSYGEERITYYRRDLRQLTGKLGNPVSHTMSFDTDSSWDYEMNEFYDAVCRDIPIQNGTIEDAVRVMRLVEQVYAADGEGNRQC